MKLKQLAISLAAFLALSVGAASNAHASITYLLVVNAAGWGGQCDLCHTAALGMAGTAVQPFAETLKTEYGLVGMQPDATLQAMLDDLRAREAGTHPDGLPPIDSDEDGAFDIAELENGGNPSDPSVTGGVTFVLPEYGCLSVAPPSRPSSVPALSAGLVALLLLRSARRRTKRS